MKKMPRKLSSAVCLLSCIGAVVVVFSHYNSLDPKLQTNTVKQRRIPLTKRPNLILKDSTILTDWTFAKKVHCPSLSIANTSTLSYRGFNMYCGDSGPHMSDEQNTGKNVTSVSFEDDCLSDFIDKYCTDELPVPNVLHYIWYGRVEVKFHHFLSFMSAVRFMKPCLIVFHGEELPYGGYWNYFTSIYSRWVHVHRPLITKVHGNTLSFKEHGADVMRIEALQKYGGLYIDTDTVLLRSINQLRQYNFTMGIEMPRALGNQFIMAKRRARFLQLWHERYKQYRRGNWGYNSLYVPFELSQKHPESIHIESDRFTRPNYFNLHKIFKSNYNWSDNYAMHLFIRVYKVKTDEVIVRTLNTTYGSVSRHILYGNKELCQ